MVFRIELGLLQKLTFKRTETEKCPDWESFHIFKVIELSTHEFISHSQPIVYSYVFFVFLLFFIHFFFFIFFLRNFYFVFINKHSILQVSLYHLITNCNSESLFGNSLHQKPAQYRNHVIYFELIGLLTIGVHTKSYFRTEYINPPITYPLS